MYHHVQFNGDKKSINLDNNTICKKYFYEECMIIRKKYRCKLKNIYFDADIDEGCGAIWCIYEPYSEKYGKILSIATSSNKNCEMIDCLCELYEELTDVCLSRKTNFYYFVDNVGTDENTLPKFITIKEALKYFYDNSYDKNDYKIYKKMKQNKCLKIFPIIDDDEIRFGYNNDKIGLDNNIVKNESFKRFCAIHSKNKIKLKNIFFEGEYEFDNYKKEIDNNKIMLYNLNSENECVKMLCELHETINII